MSCLYNIFFKTNRVVSVTCEESHQVFPCQDCPICLDACCEEKALTLPCGHSFHTWCILEWFEKQMSCPVCRRKFKWVINKKKKRRRRNRYRINRQAGLIS